MFCYFCRCVLTPYKNDEGFPVVNKIRDGDRGRYIKEGRLYCEKCRLDYDPNGMVVGSFHPAIKSRNFKSPVHPSWLNIQPLLCVEQREGPVSNYTRVAYYEGKNFEGVKIFENPNGIDRGLVQGLKVVRTENHVFLQNGNSKFFMNHSLGMKVSKFPILPLRFASGESFFLSQLIQSYYKKIISN